MTILLRNYRYHALCQHLCLAALVCTLLIAALPVAAQIDKEIFAGQRVLFNRQEPVSSKRLTLGSYKKINAQWVVEKEQRFDASLQSFTFELSDTYTLDSAWREVQSYFADKKSLLLFECEGLNCGSSSAWANERFHVQQLYGQDASQRYQVRKIEQGAENYYASLYLVQRGNRRIYFHVELLFPADAGIAVLPTLDVAVKSFVRDGFIELQGLRFVQNEVQLDENTAQFYAAVFRQDKAAKLLVVGHDYQAGSEEQSLARGSAHAEAIKKSLVLHGISAERIELRSVGFLAPDSSANAKVARVVVLRR